MAVQPNGSFKLERRITTSMKYLILISLLLQQVSFSQSTLKTIERNGYSISYPSTLRLDETGKNSTEFSLYTEKKDANDNFIENINLMIQDLKGLNIDLNKFVELTENQIANAGKLISNERIKKNNIEYQVMIYEAKMRGFDLKFLQYDFVKNEKAYFITYSAKKDEFDDYFKQMQEIMNSFKFN
ncbi:hypothetical protein [Flavobacterium sp.]|uniref:hypothetical protein n=1 Tax=Flavobacterium sp. TaxID=239 RepID=UPI0038CFBEDD